MKQIETDFAGMVRARPAPLRDRNPRRRDVEAYGGSPLRWGVASAAKTSSKGRPSRAALPVCGSQATADPGGDTFRLCGGAEGVRLRLAFPRPRPQKSSLSAVVIPHSNSRAEVRGICGPIARLSRFHQGSADDSCPGALFASAGGSSVPEAPATAAGPIRTPGLR